MTQSLKLIIESLLFASDRPISAREISGWLPEAAREEIDKALRELHQEYEAMDRSFGLKEVGEGFQLRTRSQYAHYVLQMLKTSPARLSRAAMETLAIIAYKQPILRQEIERLRGVDVGGILRTLLEKELIRIMGRKNLPGKPLIYGTTRKFLEVFDLKDLNSLPKLKEIKELGSNETQTPETRDEEERSTQPEEEQGAAEQEERREEPALEEDSGTEEGSSFQEDRGPEEDGSPEAGEESGAGDSSPEQVERTGSNTEA